MRFVSRPFRSLSGPCRLALQAVTGTVLGLRLPLLSAPWPAPGAHQLARQNSRASLAVVSATRSERLNAEDHRIYSVRMVALPPRAHEYPAQPAEGAAPMAETADNSLGPGLMASGPAGSQEHLSTGDREFGPPITSTLLAEPAPHRMLRPDVSELEVHLLDLRGLPPAAAAAAQPAAAVATALSRLEADVGAELVVGLDAEWEPELRPGVWHRISVLQLAFAGRCWLLQPGSSGSRAAEGQLSGLHATRETSAALVEQPIGGGWLPQAVQRLLTDPRVIKAGVGIQEDVRRLERDFGVQVRGAVDVRLVARQVAPQSLAAGGSLQALSAALLGRLLDKSAQRSHWGSAGRLDEGQIAYAAHDAWLSRELLCELHRLHQQHVRQLRVPGPDPAVQQPSPGAVPVLDFAAPFVGVFSGVKATRGEKALGPLPPRGRQAGGAGPGRQGPVWAPAAGSGGALVCAGDINGPGRRQKEPKLPTRKSVLYENCRLLAPDGAVLCTCGAKKVAWYLQRGLARVVSENPTTIQLKFEPRGRGHADDQYYLSDKENRCCVCGSGGEYLRHSVVPHCYRQHFPPAMKSHLSHDIVLMCPPCHKACSVADQRRMEALGRQYNAPLGSATAAKFRHDSNLGAVRSAGRALTNAKVVIPPARRRELEELLMRHFSVEVVDEALVQQAANVDPRMEDENWRSHAEQVVQALGGREQLEAFVRGWRQHFLNATRPRFMPPHWRVDARVANSSVEGERQWQRAEEAGGTWDSADMDDGDCDENDGNGGDDGASGKDGADWVN